MTLGYPRGQHHQAQDDTIRRSLEQWVQKFEAKGHGCYHSITPNVSPRQNARTFTIKSEGPRTNLHLDDPSRDRRWILSGKDQGVNVLHEDTTDVPPDKDEPWRSRRKATPGRGLKASPDKKQ